MARFRKKPVEIDAFRVKELLYLASSNWAGLPECIRDAYEGHNNAGVRGIVFEADKVSITTLEGVMIGDRDDWIIRGVRGELYPCKPEIFAATYDPVAPA